MAAALVERQGWKLIAEDEIFERAARMSKVSTDDLRRLVYGPQKFFGGLKDSRPKELVALASAVAACLETDGSALVGRLAYLIPSSVTHVLKVGIVASRVFRVDAAEKDGLTARRAEQAVERDDESRREWAGFALGKEPWDASLFDIILPADLKSVDEMVDVVVENSGKPAVLTTEASLSALRDFKHAVEVQSVFAEKGHDVDVESKSGVVRILIKKQTMFLERMKEQLVEIARHLSGVESASAHPGPRYEQASLYLDVRSELPARVLLVDDEKGFVETLSRRLHARHIDSEVALGGAEALIRLKKEEPDVMVLDLKMPGIDGIEVLRNAKANNPNTEVIILTAHGSDAEERLVFQMGAFAYLRKPVEIDELTETMKRAYAKMKKGGDRTD